MASKLLDMLHLGGCSHEFSWPRRWPGGDFYQVCLLCGEEYKYDWKSMRRLERITEARPANHLLRRQGSVLSSRAQAHKKLSWTPRARRIKVSGHDVLYRRTGTTAWHRGSVENISSSGIFFRAQEAVKENTDLEIFLEMPEEITGQKHSRVLAHGMVVRCETSKNGKPGLAVGVWDYQFVHDKRSAR